jgi:citrate lyase beta subunit
VLPKADQRSVRQLAAVTATGRWLLIVESARGLWELTQGALRAPPAVEARLAFGALDYALDLGIAAEAGGEALLHAEGQIVWMSRVLGLPGPIAAVYPRFTDPDGLVAAARRAYALGYAGQLAIHPAQIGPIAAAFAPAEATLAWARRVLAAAALGPGALAVDGALVDRPVIERARAVLAAAQPADGGGGQAGTTEDA